MTGRQKTTRRVSTAEEQAEATLRQFGRDRPFEPWREAGWTGTATRNEARASARRLGCYLVRAYRDGRPVPSAPEFVALGGAKFALEFTRDLGKLRAYESGWKTANPKYDRTLGELRALIAEVEARGW